MRKKIPVDMAAASAFCKDTPANSIEKSNSRFITLRMSRSIEHIRAAYINVNTSNLPKYIAQYYESVFRPPLRSFHIDPSV